MHLTNYSVNKFNENFVQNDDPDDDCKGHKWSLAAFKDFLNINGVNADVIFERIEDLAIKTILSIESLVFSSFE